MEDKSKIIIICNNLSYVRCASYKDEYGFADDT